MKFFELPYCEECGGAQIAHAPEKYTLILEGLIASCFGGKRSSAIERAVDRMGAKIITPERSYALTHALTRLHLGKFRPFDPKNNTRMLALLEGAEKANVRLSTFSLLGLSCTHLAERNTADGTKRNFFRLLPRPRGPQAPAFYFMDNKASLKEYLIEHRIPCAEGGTARNLREARALYRKIGRAVITKPHCGSRGRHTTVAIDSTEALERGFRIAAELSPQVIVERYLKGTVYRITLVGGKPVAVAKRDYPYVIGDSTHTITELLDIENANPRRDGIFFRPLEKTNRLDTVLASQGYMASDIPESGAKIFVNDKNSRLNGTVTDDVTDMVHPINLELFARLGEVLGDPIVGVDFMLEDMSRPWTEQEDAGVLECNSMPFIDVHHKVASGTPRNVAALLWEEVFRS